MTYLRRISLLLLLMISLPLIAACGGSTTTQTPAAATTAPNPAATSAPAATTASGTTNGGAMPAGGPDLAKLKIEDGATLLVNTWGDPPEQAINQQAFDRFSQMFPNVKINYQPVPQDFQVKLKADAAAGSLADVFYLDSSLMAALAPNDILLDLTPKLQEAGVNRDDYLGQLADIFVRDGKVYGLPKDQGSLALYVNNDLAQKAGIDPATIKTWDDWKNAAAKMTNGNVFGLCSDIDSQRVGALILQNGGELVKDNKAVFNSAQGVEAIQFWYDMYKNKHAALKSDVGAGWCGEAFAKGLTAMAMEGGWMLPFLAKDYPDFKFTAIPIPTPATGKPGSLVFTNAFAASATSKYPNAAAALVMYLTSAQNQQPILQTGFALPTVKSLINDPYFSTNPNAKVLAEAGSYGTPADIAFGGPYKKDDVVKVLGQGIERIFLGQGDVKTNLDQAQQEADQILAAQ